MRMFSGDKLGRSGSNDFIAGSNPVSRKERRLMVGKIVANVLGS